jgi:hypothetical protein
MKICYNDEDVKYFWRAIPFCFFTTFKICGHNEGDYKDRREKDGWQRKEIKEGSSQKGRIYQKYDEEKGNGVKWKEFEVDAIILI